jgi:DNA-binding transcriptional regulator YiaG
MSSATPTSAASPGHGGASRCHSWIWAVAGGSTVVFALDMALGWFQPGLRTRQGLRRHSATAVQLLAESAVTDLVPTWTGWHASALREALRMTNEDFAEHLQIAVRTVAYWRGRPDMVPRQGMQQILDVALERAPERARAQFRRLLAETGRGSAPSELTIAAACDDVDLTDWLTATSTSDEAIEAVDRAAATLAESHARIPAAMLLADVRQLQAGAWRLLAEGRPRHRQERELLRVNGDLLAHMSLLLSDLHAAREADKYGNISKLYLREAGASEGNAWYVLAKNARWNRLYGLAADLASQGLLAGSSVPMTVQLGCYEANASALAGDASRARTSMRHAEERAAALPAGQLTSSPWSFPPERMTIFRLSVALRTGDPDGALNAASGTSAAWDPAGPHVPAAWAQIRIGAGIACVLRDEPDGAAEQVCPVFDLPSGLRIATVTGWLADLDRRLAGDRYACVPLVTSLRQQISDFTMTAGAQRPPVG